MTEKIEWYKEVLEIEPNSKVFFQLARMLVEEGCYEEAFEVLEKGLNRHEEFLEARLFFIEILFKHEQHEKCAKQIEKLNNMFSSYAGFWQAWAACLSENTPDIAFALRFLAANFVLGPVSIRDLLDKGMKVLREESGDKNVKMPNIDLSVSPVTDTSNISENKVEKNNISLESPTPSIDNSDNIDITDNLDIELNDSAITNDQIASINEDITPQINLDEPLSGDIDNAETLLNDSSNLDIADNTEIENIGDLNVDKTVNIDNSESTVDLMQEMDMPNLEPVVEPVQEININESNVVVDSMQETNIDDSEAIVDNSLNDDLFDPAKAMEDDSALPEIDNIDMPLIEEEPSASVVNNENANEESFSLRTRSMADVLAEQGDVKGALDIYQELAAVSTDPAESSELQERISELNMLAGSVIDDTQIPTEEKLSPGKEKLIGLLEELAERVEARIQ